LAPGRTPQELAAMLYDSLQTKLLTLPDGVQVYPAHGAGSLCGKQLSAERSSTIGQQRANNFALQAKSREEFVHLLTSDLPERPGYFAQDAEINRSGPAPLADLPEPHAIAAEEVARLQGEGAIVLDTRPATEFGGAHIPGAVHIGLSGQFASWAGRLVGLASKIILVTEDHDTMLEARMRLARVGMENVVGFVDGGMGGWFRAGMPVSEVPQITVQDLQRELEHVQLVDVRMPGEWEQGHIEGARSKPLPKLTTMLDDLDRAQPVAVHCKSGYRSSIATSLLQRAGFSQVMNVIGGFDAWQTCGLPAAHPDKQPA
jgi:rhodanese-related sulfurtransferase